MIVSSRGRQKPQTLREQMKFLIRLRTHFTRLSVSVNPENPYLFFGVFVVSVWVKRQKVVCVLAFI